MVLIRIKPLSVNECWQGRRFKTPKYKSYQRALLFYLKPLKVPDGALSIRMVIGFSNKNSDLDNPLKPFIDILQKKYGFNDSRIYELQIQKKIVQKGMEFIDFEIISYTK